MIFNQMKYKTFLKNHFGYILGVSLLGIFSSLAMVYAGYSLSFFYTAYEYAGDKTKALLYTFLIELGIWLAAMIVCYITALAKAKIQQKLKNKLRFIISSKIASLDYIEFASKDSGHYVSWLTNDVDQIYSQSFSPLFAGIENLATAVFSLGALCLLSPFIGLAAIVLLAVISVLPQLTNKHLREANEERSAAMEIGVESYKDVIMGSPIFFPG